MKYNTNLILLSDIAYDHKILQKREDYIIKKNDICIAYYIQRVREDTGGDHLGQQQGKVIQGNVRKTMMSGRSTASFGSDKETLVQRGNECSTSMSDGNVILCDDDGKRYVILFQF